MAFAHFLPGYWLLNNTNKREFIFIKNMMLNAIYFYFNYRPSCPAIYEETENWSPKKKKKDLNIYRYMFLWFNSYGFFCQMNSIIWSVVFHSNRLLLPLQTFFVKIYFDILVFFIFFNMGRESTIENFLSYKRCMLVRIISEGG